MAKPVRTFLKTLVPTRADVRAVGWQGLLGAVLSAALVRSAFPPLNLDWMIWFALVPVLVATRAMEPRAARWTWYLFGVLWFYIASMWLNVTSFVNVMVYPGIVLMALILSLWVLLFGWTLPHLRRFLGASALVVIPMAWVAIEWLRTLSEMSFPWFYFAHALWQRPESIQSAALVGTHGLSFLIVLLNVLLAETVARKVKRCETPVVALCGVGLLFGSLYLANALGGRAAIAAIDAEPPGETVRVALLQTNWSQLDKMREYRPHDAQADLEQLMAEIEPGEVDVVIGHEMCLLDLAFPLTGRTYLAQMEAWARDLEAALVFGAGNATLREGRQIGDPGLTLGDLHNRNSAWALASSGEVTGVYDKVVLVPYSESAPLLGWIPPVRDLLLKAIVLLDPGTEAINLPIVTESHDFPLGVNICFESTIPWHVRRFTERGARALATITNDAWFFESSGPRLHWLAQPFRAVENRRWSVQAAQTGISGIVDPAGRIVAATDLNERTVLTGTIELREGTTVYTRHGDWLAHIFLGLSALAMAGALIRRRGAPPR